MGAAAGVGVDVAGRHAGHAEPLGEAGEPAVARAVVAPVGPLQLDAEAVAAEGGEQAIGEAARAARITPRPGPRHRPIPRAARQADQALGMLFELLQRDRRLFGRPPSVVPSVRVGRGQQPTEVSVSDRVFDQKSEMNVAGRG